MLWGQPSPTSESIKKRGRRSAFHLQSRSLLPLETAGLLRFADGLEDLIVVEEKRGLVETQIVKALYNLDRRPRVVGKFDEAGADLFPSTGELNPLKVARALGQRLALRIDSPDLRQRLSQVEDRCRGTTRYPPL